MLVFICIDVGKDPPNNTENSVNRCCLLQASVAGVISTDIILYCERMTYVVYEVAKGVN